MVQVAAEMADGRRIGGTVQRLPGPAGRFERKAAMRRKKRREELHQLWKDFKEEGDQGARCELIETYMPLVRHAAERLKGKLPQCVEIEEMVSAGNLGLIDAVDKFDPERGILFETYCSVRIRGSILDALRATDWVPRLIRTKAHRLDLAKLALAFELGRDPTDNEVSERMGMSMAEYYELIDELDVHVQLPIEAMQTEDAEDGDGQRVDLVEDRDQAQPLERLSLLELRSVAQKGLSPKERRVLSMYYFDNLTMKEIGAIMSISESRVCQVHAAIMKHLRERFREDIALASRGRRSA
jgi:RNA polymerase sigma factor for flagellar operon FliA